MARLKDEEITNHTLNELAMKVMGLLLAILGFLGAFLFYKIFNDADMLHERVHQLEIQVEVLKDVI